jgi:hypothetical protein
MQQRCAKHVFEGAEDACRTCGGQFCDGCLVYAFGPKNPPLCIQCAVAAAGIRASACGKRGTSVLGRLRFARISNRTTVDKPIEGRVRIDSR